MTTTATTSTSLTPTTQLEHDNTTPNIIKSNVILQHNSNTNNSNNSSYDLTTTTQVTNVTTHTSNRRSRINNHKSIHNNNNSNKPALSIDIPTSTSITPRTQHSHKFSMHINRVNQSADYTDSNENNNVITNYSNLYTPKQMNNNYRINSNHSCDTILYSHDSTTTQQQQHDIDAIINKKYHAFHRIHGSLSNIVIPALSAQNSPSKNNKQQCINNDNNSYSDNNISQIILDKNSRNTTIDNANSNNNNKAITVNNNNNNNTTISTDTIEYAHRDVIIIIICLTTCIGLASLDSTIANVAAPAITSDFGSFNLFGWIVSGYMLTSASFTPIYGKTSDIFGRHISMQFALLMFGIGSLVGALATNMIMLIIGRCIQGLGSSGLTSLTNVILGDLLSPAEQGKYAFILTLGMTVFSVSGYGQNCSIIQYKTLHMSCEIYVT